MPTRIPTYILLSHISGSKWWIVAILDARRSIKAYESTLRRNQTETLLQVSWWPLCSKI